MKPSSPKPSDESIGEDRPLAFSITNILHHVSILHLLEILNDLGILITISVWTLKMDQIIRALEAGQDLRRQLLLRLSFVFTETNLVLPDVVKICHLTISTQITRDLPHLPEI